MKAWVYFRWDTDLTIFILFETYLLTIDDNTKIYKYR